MVAAFPVQEIPLEPVPRRALGFIPSRRSLAAIPIQQPGTTLVFNTGDKWIPVRSRIIGTESFVVQAVAVSIVQTRTYEVPVEILIPSASLADDFTIVCLFNCRVVDVVRAAEQGPYDVAKALGNFLRKDRGLQAKGLATAIADVHSLRIPVDARIRAYCDEVGPALPGLEVHLSSVEVATPASLRTHHGKLRDAAFARDLAKMLASHEDEDARALAARLNEPEYLAALGVLRDKVDIDKVLSAVFADRATKDANILELLKLLEKNGQLDRLPIDGRVLVNTLMSRLGGIPAGPATVRSADAMLGIDSDTLKSIDSSAKRKEKRFAVDDESD